MTRAPAEPAIAVPVENGQRCGAYVGTVQHDDDVRYQAYFARDGGRRQEFFGPVWSRPADALRYIERATGQPGRV